MRSVECAVMGRVITMGGTVKSIERAEVECATSLFYEGTVVLGKGMLLFCLFLGKGV